MKPIELQLKTTQGQVILISDAIKHRIETLQDQTRDIQNEISDLQILLNQLDLKYQEARKEFATVDVLTEVSVGYNSSWSFSDKAEYIIRKHGHPLTTAEIANRIKDLEPDLDRAVIVRNLSVVFANQKKRFIRLTNDKGENTYGVKN